MFPFKNIKRGVFPLNKIRIKNFAGVGMYVGKLQIYFGDYINDIGTIIFKRKNS